MEVVKFNIIKRIKGICRVKYYTLLSFIFRNFTFIHKGRVFFEYFGNTKYACNPKYISEYILNNCPNDYELIWPFREGINHSHINGKIKSFSSTSIKAFYYINTSEFIISNHRINGHWTLWKKRKGQKYIMTWHGGTPLKKIEFDATECLPEEYLRKALKDSADTDLQLSDSLWCTETFARCFKYHGEFLNKGIPKNDIFFNNSGIATASAKVRKFYEIPNETKILLYAPTFRTDKSIDKYIFKWETLLDCCSSRFEGPFIVLVRLHPNMIGIVDSSTMVKENNVIDATLYDDIQELMCASDILLTDYSSTMFEFSLLKKPVFLYTPDLKEYDRGFYFNIDSLPFNKSMTLKGLANQILTYSEDENQRDIEQFFVNTLKYNQTGPSCPFIIKWMKEHSIK